MKWHHWYFFWVGTSSSFGTLCHNGSIWFFQGTNGVSKMKVRLITAWSLGQEYLLRQNTSNENSPVGFLWMLLWLRECRKYLYSESLAGNASAYRCKSCSCSLCGHSMFSYEACLAIWPYLTSPCMTVRTQKMLGSPRTLLATTRWMWAEQKLKRLS